MDGFNSTTLGAPAFATRPSYLGLCGIVLAVILYEIWVRTSPQYKKLRNFPGPMRYPIVGNAHLVLGLNNNEIVQKALEYMQQFGETGCGYLGYKPVVFLTNPVDIEMILGSEKHIDKSGEYKIFKPWFGNGLLISKGDHWRYHRKMIAPTFHQSILKSFVPNFVKYSRKVANKLERQALGKEIDVHDYMSQTTVEILLSTIMGVKKMITGYMCLRYAKSVIGMCDIIHKRHLKFIYRPDLIYKLTPLSRKGEELMSSIRSLAVRVVKERFVDTEFEEFGIFEERKSEKLSESVQKTATEFKKEGIGLRDDLDDIDESDVGAKRRLALLDAMVEMTNSPEHSWTIKDVLDEVNTLMFEGHDTTSAASSFVLCLLGIHQDVQERVFEEQKSIFGDDLQRECTFADTLQMNYLERVIKETLRLYPPVPAIARLTNEEVKLASGPYTIPKGTTVVLVQYAVQRRPDLYDNPTQFNPDNFLPEHMAKRHYYSFVPFSAGPRSCVGRKYAMLMLKILLSTILRKVKVRSNRTETDFKLEGSVILKLANGFKVILEPRSQT